MLTIKQDVLYVGSKAKIKLYALFNSEADISCISPTYVNDLTIVHPLRRTRKIFNTSNGHLIEVSEVVLLEFYINDILLRDEFFVVPTLDHDVIIGDATMRKCRIRLNFEENKVEVAPRDKNFIKRTYI